MNLASHALRVASRADLPTFVERVFAALKSGTPFLPNWHYEHLCWVLERVRRGDLHRLIINVPPRSGKSIIATVAWPLFVLGHDPAKRVICVSHTEDLARKFAVDRRFVAQQPWYRRTFPTMRLAGPEPRDLELVTTARGSRLATGIGILGRGANVILVDDPIKALDALSAAERRRVAEFYNNTLITRLNDKRAGAVVIMQRLHQDDLVGHVLERDEWEVVSLPAIATDATVHRLSDVPGDVHRRPAGELLHPQREPQEVLDQVRRSQGSLTFQAQYQQEPVPAGGNVVQRGWLRFYEEADRPERFDRTIVSWDTARTAGGADRGVRPQLDARLAFGFLQDARRHPEALGMTADGDADRRRMLRRGGVLRFDPHLRAPVDEEALARVDERGADVAFALEDGLGGSDEGIQRLAGDVIPVGDS